ncbi:MAG: GntR family transcriptional regulator [Syntrophomonas sp.]|nr:GntR family transcriptional regulator [Syntrophomonas sp.]
MAYDSSRPIFRQIIDDFQKQLVRGELKQGDKIPSQREYAEKARINPNTVQRAYREMETMHMVETLRGKGTYITVSEQMLADIKFNLAQKILDYFIREMESLGYDYARMIKLLHSEQDQRRVENQDD